MYSYIHLGGGGGGALYNAQSRKRTATAEIKVRERGRRRERFFPFSGAHARMCSERRGCVCVCRIVCSRCIEPLPAALKGQPYEELLEATVDPSFGELYVTSC